MGKKWGSNEDIHVGDIFHCWSVFGDELWEYYQVVELRGKSQVVLHAVQSERYINEIVPEDGPLWWAGNPSRPLPGQFVPWTIWSRGAVSGGKTPRIIGQELHTKRIRPLFLNLTACLSFLSASARRLYKNRSNSGRR